MSLRDEWYAARAQRQQEIQFRQQQVLEHRQQTQMNLSARATHRAAMSAAMWDSLHNFHSRLQSSMANFLEDTRAYQQQTWLCSKTRGWRMWQLCDIMCGEQRQSLLEMPAVEKVSHPCLRPS
ncbi:MAG: hypothetical protein MUC60_03415 [Oscillatoria sp. Prado101]|nr:hypothetical protein [Oscillatoria sp. Prado101]